MDWLTKELRLEVAKVFEPLYGFRLTDKEIVEIVGNLTNCMEHLVKTSNNYNENKKKN